MIALWAEGSTPTLTAAQWAEKQAAKVKAMQAELALERR